MTRNQIAYWSMREDKRHNKATEKETNRANLASEAENVRSHKATEGINISNLQEQSRHNVAVESETNRSNVANEGLKGVDLNIKQQQADETKRHNSMSEKVDMYNAVSKRVESQTDKAYKEAMAAAKAYENVLKEQKNTNDVEYAKKELEIKKQQAETAYKQYEANKNAKNAEVYLKYWSTAVNDLLKIINMLKTAKG